MTVSTDTAEDLCSTALNMIGADPINSITDPTTDIEATCARIYPQRRDLLLSRFDWSFGRSNRQLARNADKTPQGSFLYAYRLPSDMLAGPFSVFDTASMKTAVHQWVNAEDHIHCDYAKLYILYRKIPEISIWPAYFRALLVKDLASELAKPVADNTQLKEELYVEAYGSPEFNGNGGLFAEAKKIDSQSRPIRSLFSSGDPLTSLRY